MLRKVVSLPHQSKSGNAGDGSQVFRHKKRARRSGAKCTVVSLRKEGMVFRSETMRQFGGRGLVPSQQTLATRVLPQSNIHIAPLSYRRLTNWKKRCAALGSKGR